MAWAMELYQRGIIDNKMTKIPLRWGDGKTIVELLDQIAHRRGFGDILAEGSYGREIFGETSGPIFWKSKISPLK